MLLPKEIIVTPRLRLRSLAPTDFRPLHDHVLSHTAVMALAFSAQPMSMRQAREFIDRNFDHDASGTKLGVLIERATGQVIGFAGLLQCDTLEEPDYELGCAALLGATNTRPRSVADNSNTDLTF